MLDGLPNGGTYRAIIAYFSLHYKVTIQVFYKDAHLINPFTKTVSGKRVKLNNDNFHRSADFCYQRVTMTSPWGAEGTTDEVQPISNHCSKYIPHYPMLIKSYVDS